MRKAADLSRFRNSPLHRRRLFFVLGLSVITVATCITPTERPVAEPRVEVGADFVSKKTFFRDERLGGISSIEQISGSELIVAGGQGAARLGLNGMLRSFTTFDHYHHVAQIVPVDVDGDGTHEFVNRGGGWQPVSFIGSDGKTRWRYPQKRRLFDRAPNEMSFAGLENGLPTFIVGMNASDVRILNSEGKVIREFDARGVFSVAVSDVLPNQGLEFIHCDTDGVRIRARDGQILGTLPIQSPFTLLNSASGGPVTDPIVVVREAKNIVSFYTPDGTKTDSYVLPGDPVATVYAVTLTGGSGRLVAMTHTLSNEQGSVLYIFADGQLAYQEVFTAYDLALLAPKDGERLLYVGAGDELLQYTMIGTSSDS